MVKKFIIIVTLNFILSASVFSHNLDSFVSQIDNTYEVQSALLNVKAIKSEILLLTHPEDISFSLNPAIKAFTQEGGTFGESIEIYGSASIKIPLGIKDYSDHLNHGKCPGISINRQNGQNSAIIVLI